MRSTIHNQIDSPLLQLPGELRNRIYKFAISGHIVVIKAVWTMGMTCRLKSKLYVPGRGNSAGIYHGSSNDPIMIEEDYEDEFGKCLGPVSTIFALSKVSRQLKAETASLQCATNVFYFKDAWALRLFAGKLSSTQTEAIQSISLDPDGEFLTALGSSIPHWPEALPIWLPRLKNIYMAPDRHFWFHWIEGDRLSVTRLLRTQTWYRVVEVPCLCQNATPNLYSKHRGGASRTMTGWSCSMCLAI